MNRRNLFKSLAGLLAAPLLPLASLAIEDNSNCVFDVKKIKERIEELKNWRPRSGDIIRGNKNGRLYCVHSVIYTWQVGNNASPNSIKIRPISTDIQNEFVAWIPETSIIRNFSLVAKQMPPEWARNFATVRTKNAEDFYKESIFRIGKTNGNE